MNSELVQSLTSAIINEQDKDNCWNVLSPGDNYYPQCNYYVPNYKSTLWTLIFLADIQCDPKAFNFLKPLKTMSDHLLDTKLKIYSIGKSHFPIPCLNGNMLYLHSYFNHEDNEITTSIINLFTQYQRFDDGGYKTPKSFPYFSNKSCYGGHTCYWGVVKLLKGISFFPPENRTEKATKLMEKCIDFILLHKVCFSSHNDSEYLHTNIKKLTFPNMYQSDFLEILWLLKREAVQSKKMDKALDLLRSKMLPDGTWKTERQIKDLAISFSKKLSRSFVTERAGEVLDYYGY